MKIFACFILLCLAAGGAGAQVIATLPTVQSIGADDLSGLIRDGKGKIVVVNFWASWCKPCRDEMPSLVKLRKTYGKEINLILVSADDSDLIESKVRLMLRTFHVGFHSFQMDQNSVGEFMKKMQPGYTGALALPTTFLFDKTGKLATKFTGGQKYQKFSSAVASLH
jgi:thiol-disulfide isomerase/thioredoxin